MAHFSPGGQGLGQFVVRLGGPRVLLDGDVTGPFRGICLAQVTVNLAKPEMKGRVAQFPLLSFHQGPQRFLVISLFNQNHALEDHRGAALRLGLGFAFQNV